MEKEGILYFISMCLKNSMVELLLYSIPVILLLCTLVVKKYRKYYLVQKTISSLCFFGLAVYAAITSDNWMTFLYMLPGFLLCIFGDVLLGIYNKKRNKKVFLGGVFVFLMGHICFISSTCLLQEIRVIDFIFPVFGVVLVMYMANHTELSLGRLRPYAYLYSFFVSLLFSKCMRALITLRTPQAICLGIGGALFLISDFLILFLYFYKKRPWSTHGWNIATYYYAMFCLAISIMYACL